MTSETQVRYFCTVASHSGILNAGTLDASRKRTVQSANDTAGKKFAPMDGLIVLDKPAGITSARAVSRVKRLLPRGTKIGHAGTPSPLESFCCWWAEPPSFAKTSWINPSSMTPRFALALRLRQMIQNLPQFAGPTHIPAQFLRRCWMLTHIWRISKEKLNRRRRRFPL